MDFDFMVDALLKSVSHIGFSFKHGFTWRQCPYTKNDMKT